jgi:hypothetical protein
VGIGKGDPERAQVFDVNPRETYQGIEAAQQCGNSENANDERCKIE